MDMLYYYLELSFCLLINLCINYILHHLHILIYHANCKSVLLLLFKDIGDLQNFVTIALATAAGGEDDFTRDRLSNLRTVGKGFATLIYKLPQDMGYKELEARCKSLWEALHQDPRLPALLVN